MSVITLDILGDEPQKEEQTLGNDEEEIELDLDDDSDEPN